ncbi:cell division protein ZapA [Edaphobacter modestus]|uniref:Cell division protein ZapA n=1 Tax=Edaphobacter modestus TaxID=388466 RepID=A0A4Q7YYG2_9BACT|nr:cell division protein ZapA [Edaphobacter modestus]RZU42291.1 cell division protein ZapA [Edaphobacter modestus]
MDYNSTLTAPPPQPPSPAESKAVAVEIYDQVYHLRGTDPAYIEQLARVVDAKMRAVSAHGNTVDSLRVAVLAALNISDELESLRQRYDALAGSLSLSQVTLRSRAGSLVGMLDEILEDRKVG